MKKYPGSCLCQAVTYEVSCEFVAFFLCHCSHCRKETGSAHAANLFSNISQFEWISGRENVKTFFLQGTRFAKSFCTNCGSALPTVQGNGSVLVPAGSLDCDLDLKPNAHILMDSKANWDEDFHALPKFPGYPE